MSGERYRTIDSLVKLVSIKDMHKISVEFNLDQIGQINGELAALECLKISLRLNYNCKEMSPCYPVDF